MMDFVRWTLTFGQKQCASLGYAALPDAIAAFDLQRIWNPGYNRDRGPVLVGAIRLHLEGALFREAR